MLFFSLTAAYRWFIKGMLSLTWWALWRGIVSTSKTTGILVCVCHCQSNYDPLLDGRGWPKDWG